MKIIIYILCNLIALVCYAEHRITSIKSLLNFSQENPSTRVMQCTKSYRFNYKPFPLKNIYGNHLWHSNGIFQDIFIIEVKDAMAYMNAENKRFVNCKDKDYFLFINDTFIKGTSFYPSEPQQLSFYDETLTQYIPGKVAIIYHQWYPEYGHFLIDVLSALALFEIFQIEYDYLLIPYDCQFMKEILDLWGIDKSKIIPFKPNSPIKAEVLMFNTAIGIITNKFYTGIGLYYIDFLVQYIRNKLLSRINNLNLSLPTSSKIFLSKKDSITQGRKIPNEDEVFKEFEKHGYQRYEFTKMSMVEKIYRASKATHFVSSTGSGCHHAIFMQSNGCLFEISSALPDSAFCYLMQNVNINYQCINCTTVEDLYNVTNKNIPIDIIQEYIKSHPEI